jgi:hypothetical protein
MYTIQDLKKYTSISCLVWFLLASQIREFFLPQPVFRIPDDGQSPETQQFSESIQFSKQS